MAKVQVQVTVEQNTYQAGQAVAAFVTTLKTEVAAGWNTAKDMPATLAAALADLVPVLGNLAQVPAEAKEDKAAFANALALSLTAALL